MSILVLAEHNNIDIKPSTLNTISAASQIEQEIEVLVTGFQCCLLYTSPSPRDSV